MLRCRLDSNCNVCLRVTGWYHISHTLLDQTVVTGQRFLMRVFGLSVFDSCAPSVSLGLLSAGRPSWQQHWKRALQEHIILHHELPHGVRLQQRPGWWRPGVTIARPLTHEEIVPPALLARQPLHSLKTSPAAAVRCAIHADPVVGDRFLDMLDRCRTERRWGMHRRLAEVRRLCARMFDGINQNTVPLETERAACITARQEDSRDTAQRAHHASDRGPVPQRLVHEWLDAQVLDARPGETWVKQLLRCMRLSCKKPAKCVKEMHSHELQHANTHLLFIKLCWLMDKHSVSADRVVNIDETSFPPTTRAGDESVQVKVPPRREQPLAS